MPAIERRSGALDLLVAASRGSGGGARPGSRSSGRRRDCGAGSSAGRRGGGRAAPAPRRSPARPRPCARARRRSARRGARLDQLEVAGGDVQARLRERHLEVLDQRAEERPPAVEAAQLARRRRAAKPSRSRTRRAGGSGSASRRRPRGSPGASQESPPSGRRAGREPISSSASSSTGVNARKKRDEALVLPDERRGRRACARADSASSVLARAVGRASARVTSGNAESSVAASAPRGCGTRAPGRPYLNEIVSPCSVSLRRPGGCPAGWARMAAWVGPPPRPALPPRPWKIVSSIPPLGRERGERLLRAEDLPLRREVAAVLAGVRVADHHLEPAPALLDPAAKRGSSSSYSTIAGAARRSAIVSKSGTGETRAPARAGRATASTSAADSVPDTITVSSARVPSRSCASRDRAERLAHALVAGRELRAWKRTSSFATWNPNSSTRRRRSARRPSAMRAPRCARRLRSTTSRSAWSSSARA